jgi:hypothetical protein
MDYLFDKFVKLMEQDTKAEGRRQKAEGIGHAAA